MGTKYIALEQLPSEMDKIFQNILQQAEGTKISTTRKAGMFMVSAAKRLAPHLTGDTEEGIFGKKNGTNYVVISQVDGLFKQNIWADNRVGFKRPYPLHQKTGIQGGGFFTIAGDQTAKYFKDIVVKDISKWETVKG